MDSWFLPGEGGKPSTDFSLDSWFCQVGGGYWFCGEWHFLVQKEQNNWFPPDGKPTVAFVTRCGETNSLFHYFWTKSLKPMVDTPPPLDNSSSWSAGSLGLFAGTTPVVSTMPLVRCAAGSLVFDLFVFSSSAGDCLEFLVISGCLHW